MLLLLGFADVVQLVRGHIRVQSAATQIGQIVSQCKRVSGGDEARLKELTWKILGPFASGGDWALVIHAKGLDAKKNPIAWRMPEKDLPAIAAKPQGAALPPGLELKENEVVFTTEVFARLKTTFLFQTRNAQELVVNMTRAASVADLKNQSTSDTTEDCMKRTS